MGFELVYQMLNSAILESVERLKEPIASREEKEALVGSKLAFDTALACLKLCEKHGITSSSRVVVLPQKTTTTELSEYRLVEDQETEDRACWIEVRVGGKLVRPAPGSVLIEPT